MLKWTTTLRWWTIQQHKMMWPWSLDNSFQDIVVVVTVFFPWKAKYFQHLSGVGHVSGDQLKKFQRSIYRHYSSNDPAPCNHCTVFRCQEIAIIIKLRLSCSTIGWSRQKNDLVMNEKLPLPECSPLSVTAQANETNLFQVERDCPIGG